MTATQILNTYFSLPADILYVLVIFCGAVWWLANKWEKTRRECIRLVVLEINGDTTTHYVPKDGSSVSLTKPGSNTTRIWPISDICMARRSYPSDLVPAFLRGTIQEVWVDEGDWEPILNRSPFNENVASPDVVEMLQNLACEWEQDPTHVERAATLREYATSLSTAPTRKMIASPAVLGNLMHEKISERMIMASKEVLDRVEGLMHKLDNACTSNKLYVCTGIIVLVVGVAGYLVYQQQDNVTKSLHKIQLIENALGIVEVTVNGTSNQTAGK